MNIIDYIYNVLYNLNRKFIRNKKYLNIFGIK